MNLMEKLETRFDEQIVFPDELAREAYSEIKRLREALENLIGASNCYCYDGDVCRVCKAEDVLLNVQGGSNDRP